MVLSGSRTEFLAADALGAANDIQYGRTGGCFVSIRRGFLVALLVVLAMVAVGLLVYYFAPRPPLAEQSDATSELSTGMGMDEDGGMGKGSGDLDAFRLPPIVRPRHYNLWVQTFVGDDSNFTFKGMVSIEVFCDREDPCDTVELHAKDLSIEWEAITLARLPEGVSSVAEDDARDKRAVGKKYGATDKPDAASATTLSPTATTMVAGDVGNSTDDAEAVTNGTSSASPASPTVATPASMKLKLGRHSVNTEKDTFTLNLEIPMESGQNYTLKIPFSGNITSKLSGYYRSSYKDKSGTKRWLAATHFEPTYARRAFPCFDEPAMKARFEVHIGRRNSSRSTSNMPLRSSEPMANQPGWYWDHYKPSPIMSTYLVAYMVSDFGIMKSENQSPLFEVMAREELLPTANYSLDIGQRILAHYNDYFNISYPLPKMTMAAIPDFAAGAMENWGLILYRESVMLYETNTATARTKQAVAEVVAHELAHQWFGNLVTMVWWTDLWLNEGFATYVSYIGVNHVEPTWNVNEIFVSEQMHPVLETDSLDSTHRVSVEVYNPAQISELFDEVSYNKGACLIRMLNHSLTEPVFRAGISHYLNKWAYKNARQDDLWDALTKAASEAGSGTDFERLPPGTTVKQVMDTWTLQKGYPVIYAIRDYVSGSVQLNQSRFRLSGQVLPAQNKVPEQWYVPISVSNGVHGGTQDTRAKMWLTPEHSSNAFTLKNVTAPGSDTWLLINQQQTGYYRVNYDAANWYRLIQQLNKAPNELPATTRAQLLSDALNLARAGLLDYSTALNLTLYMVGRETHLVPWQSALHALDHLSYLLRSSRVYVNFQSYITQLMSPLLDTLGLEPKSNDTLPDRVLRQLLISELLKAEVPRVLDWALQLFTKWSSSKPTENPIPVDVRYYVYCSAVRHGGVREWSAVHSRFVNSDDQPVERSNLLRALMCTRQTNLLNTMFEQSLEENGEIRLQDSSYVWRSAIKNPVASYLTFRYIRENWNNVFNRFNKVPFVLREVVRSSIDCLSTELDYKDVQTFEKEHPGNFTSIKQTFQQAVEKLRLRTQWRQRHQKDVESWLKSFAEPTTIL